MVELSVVIPSYNPGPRLEACLASLARQQRGPTLEVILCDSSTDGSGHVALARHPGIRLLRSETRLFPGEARNLGCAAATAPVIAFLDADCDVPPEWACRVLETHRRGHRIVGAAVAPALPESPLGWAGWFVKCHRWAPQSPPGARPDLPGCSLSVERSVLGSAPPFPSGVRFSEDTLFCWRMRRQGVVLWFEPSLQVRHHWTPALREFLCKQWRHGRAFASLRDLTTLRRLALLLGSPLLGPLLLLRLVRNVQRYGIYPGQLRRCWWLVAAGMLAWAGGETWGYLTRSSGSSRNLSSCAPPAPKA